MRIAIILGTRPEIVKLSPIIRECAKLGLNFLILEGMAKLVLTDSGGVQEEACILGVPCVTLRDNTERPETIEVGANQLAGTNPEIILKAAESMNLAKKGWANPLGNGHTGEAIIKILLSKAAAP